MEKVENKIYELRRQNVSFIDPRWNEIENTYTGREIRQAIQCLPRADLKVMIKENYLDGTWLNCKNLKVIASNDLWKFFCQCLAFVKIMPHARYTDDNEQEFIMEFNSGITITVGIADALTVISNLMAQVYK